MTALPYTQRHADYLAKLQQAASEKTAKLDQAQAMVVAAQDAYDAAVRAEKAALEAEILRREREIGPEDHAALLPLARAFAGGRPEAMAFREVWIQRDKHARVALPPRGGHGEAMGGIGMRTYLVFADLYLERDPGALGAFISSLTSGTVSIQYSPVEVTSRTNTVLLQGDPITVVRGLEDLEACVAHVARTNRAMPARAKEIWAAIIGHATLAAGMKAVQEIKAQDRAKDEARLQQVVRKYDAEQAAHRARDGYSGLMPTMQSIFERAIGR